MSKKEKIEKKSRRGYKERSVKTRPIRQRFLIVCEGKETEPNYFKGFRVSKDIHGLGKNTISLVKSTVELAKKDDYDQVWCVFDKDSFPHDDFNEAIRLAKQNEIQVAYSNQAFELWYLLHFQYCDTAISRHQYQNKLSKLLGEPYTKNAQTMYQKLYSRQETALKYAKKLFKEYEQTRPFSERNPSTTVHLLVEELNRHLP